MPDHSHEKRMTDAPVPYRTAQRPGQPGDQDERRAGPNPLSDNPTGPHAPYERDDRDGAAASKHRTAPAPGPVVAAPTKPAPSQNFQTIDGRTGKAEPCG